MRKADFKKGQTVYLLPIRFDGYEYHRIERQIKEATVETIGYQYITVVLYGRPIRFNIFGNFNQVSNCSPDYRLYLSKEDIQNEFKRKEDKKLIINSFKWMGILDRIADEDLQTIIDIIHKYKH